MKLTSSLIVLAAALVGVSELFAQTTTGGSGSSSGSSMGAGSSVTVSAPTTTTSPPPVVTVTPVDPTIVHVTPGLNPGSAAEARLVNLSTRARVTAASPLITGFAISGTTSRPVLVRAAGPALTGFGVSGALAAPRLQLRDATGALVAENTGWADASALANASAQAGAFPFARGSADSAVVVTLAPGTYTVQVSDAVGGNDGVTLAEIYDLGSPVGGSRLVNVSTRATVAAGGSELISGFVLAGTAPRSFLVRGVGPGLVKFGVNGTLANPAIAVFDTTGHKVALNDDWTGSNPGAISLASVISPAAAAANVDALRAAAKSAGAFDLDLNSYDAALVATLLPGAYTVQVTGNSVVVVSSNGTNSSGAGSSNSVVGPAQAVTVSLSVVPPSPGVALLELYELP